MWLIGFKSHKRQLDFRPIALLSQGFVRPMQFTTPAVSFVKKLFGSSSEEPTSGAIVDLVTPSPDKRPDDGQEMFSPNSEDPVKDKHFGGDGNHEGTPNVEVGIEATESIGSEAEASVENHHGSSCGGNDAPTVSFISEDDDSRGENKILGQLNVGDLETPSTSECKAEDHHLVGKPSESETEVEGENDMVKDEEESAEEATDEEVENEHHKAWRDSRDLFLSSIEGEAAEGGGHDQKGHLQENEEDDGSLLDNLGNLLDDRIDDDAEMKGSLVTATETLPEDLDQADRDAVTVLVTLNEIQGGERSVETIAVLTGLEEGQVTTALCDLETQGKVEQMLESGCWRSTALNSDVTSFSATPRKVSCNLNDSLVLTPTTLVKMAEKDEEDEAKMCHITDQAVQQESEMKDDQLTLEENSVDGFQNEIEQDAGDVEGATRGEQEKEDADDDDEEEDEDLSAPLLIQQSKVSLGGWLKTKVFGFSAPESSTVVNEESFETSGELVPTDESGKDIQPDASHLGDQFGDHEGDDAHFDNIEVEDIENGIERKDGINGKDHKLFGVGKEAWTPLEVEALRKGVEKYGHKAKRWMLIKADPCFSVHLEKRTNVDLKDRWRTRAHSNRGAACVGSAATAITSAPSTQLSPASNLWGIEKNVDENEEDLTDDAGDNSDVDETEDEGVVDLIGVKIRKEFGSEWFVGIVSSWEDPFWVVTYQDGETEEMDELDVSTFAVNHPFDKGCHANKKRSRESFLHDHQNDEDGSDKSLILCSTSDGLAPYSADEPNNTSIEQDDCCVLGEEDAASIKEKHKSSKGRPSISASKKARRALDFDPSGQSKAQLSSPRAIESSSAPLNARRPSAPLSAKPGKAKREAWTESEVHALRGGMAKYSSRSNRWAQIKADPDFSDVLEKRTNVNLKDKWRTITKAEA